MEHFYTNIFATYRARIIEKLDKTEIIGSREYIVRVQKTCAVHIRYVCIWGPNALQVKTQATTDCIPFYTENLISIDIDSVA